MENLQSTISPEDLKKVKEARKRGMKRGAYAVMLLIMVVGFSLLFNVANTGKVVHEFVASTIIFLVVLHVLKNYRFFGRLTGKPAKNAVNAPNLYSNPYFIYSNLVTLLLIGYFIVMAITGMFMSKYVFHWFIELTGIPYPPPNRLVHGMFAYLLFPFLCLHIGLHVGKLFSLLERTINKGFSNAVKLGFALLGLHGIFCLFMYDFGPKFRMERTPPFNLQGDTLPHFFFIIDIVSMGAFFVMVSFTISQYLIKLNAKKIKAKAQQQAALKAKETTNTPEEA